MHQHTAAGDAHPAQTHSGAVATAPAERVRRKRLFVFDFDHTLIPADSDESVLTNLAGKPRFDEMTKAWTQGALWPSLVGCEMRRLLSQGALASLEQLKDILRGVPMCRETVDLLHKLKARDDTVVAIISDGNTLFISMILEHHGVRDCFDYLIANHATLAPASASGGGGGGGGEEEGNASAALTFEIIPQMKDHGCRSKFCTPTLCKAKALTALKKQICSEHSCQIVETVYAGDGSNDFCAVTCPDASVDFAAVICGRKLENLLRTLTEQRQSIGASCCDELVDENHGLPPRLEYCKDQASLATRISKHVSPF